MAGTIEKSDLLMIMTSAVTKSFQISFNGASTFTSYPRSLNSFISSKDFGDV
eukprot:CAMPEP_0178841440 /NCGR_PEP_ID=MMETSP0746-20121128/14940_1 /TAXON_ID=913974 /ORGANISM="Nitzschia punctata, Strain CCMP561" /LENGTH=51 /DNA_ID=CAMNT_0020504639 /DNA_START=134 /DNA_END=289 /DNA_ORIENTATION=+